MPQGDFVNFSSTTAAAAVGFLGGYFVWVGWWAPRVVALLKVKNWLHRAGSPAATAIVVPRPSRPSLSVEHLGPGLAVTGVVESFAWPEAFLVVVQFVLLAILVTRLSLPEGATPVTALVVPTGEFRQPVSGPAFLAANLAGFLGLWHQRRDHLLVGGPTRAVTGVTEVVLLNLQVTPLRGHPQHHVK